MLVTHWRKLVEEKPDTYKNHETKSRVLVTTKASSGLNKDVHSDHKKLDKEGEKIRPDCAAEG